MTDHINSPEPHRGPLAFMTDEELSTAYERAAADPENPRAEMLLAELQHRGLAEQAAMKEVADEYHARLVGALAKTVFDQSLIDLDGKPTAYIRTAEACEALISVLGMLMEGAPNCRTPQGMRKMSEAVGRNALGAMKAARAVREGSGQSIFGGDGVVIN